MQIVAAVPWMPEFIWNTDWETFLQKLSKKVDIVWDGDWAKKDFPVFYDSPLIGACRNVDMIPTYPHVQSRRRNVGIAVPMEQGLVKKYVTNISRYWDGLIALSTWVEEMIRDAGYQEVTTIITSPTLQPAPPTYQPDDIFRIFSGGKLEIRKAQDIIIQAVGIMMQRHKDVELVYDWYNPWQSSADTIKATPLWQRSSSSGVIPIMRECGVDIKRTRALQTPNSTPAEHATDKAEAYLMCDVGLFPNRAEGCVNSFVVEMMAARRAVIGLYAHGQRDILDPTSPLTLHTSTPLPVNNLDGEHIADWFEPSLDEIVEKLEWAYLHREALEGIGERGTQLLLPYREEVWTQKYVDELFK